MEPIKIFENDHFLVLNKPAGWIVNDAETTGDTPTVQTWLRNNKLGEGIDRNGIVHRLDKDTSGILLVAKSQIALKNLQSQFKERTIKKTYVALAHGIVVPPEGEVNAPVGRLPWNRERFGIVLDGREAKTKYKVISVKTKDGENYSELELNPETGRTHQIRVHLQYLGYPIVSDEFYVGRKTYNKDKIWCPRLFLHAYKILLNDPVSGDKIEFTAELPEDLKKPQSLLQKG